MKVFVDYGMDQARNHGRPNSLIMMLNDHFRHDSRAVPAPRDNVELEIYRLISEHSDLDPDLREILGKIIYVYCGS